MEQTGSSGGELLEFWAGQRPILSRAADNLHTSWHLPRAVQAASNFDSTSSCKRCSWRSWAQSDWGGLGLYAVGKTADKGRHPRCLVHGMSEGRQTPSSLERRPMARWQGRPNVVMEMVLEATRPSTPSSSLSGIGAASRPCQDPLFSLGLERTGE